MSKRRAGARDRAAKALSRARRPLTANELAVRAKVSVSTARRAMRDRGVAGPPRGRRQTYRARRQAEGGRDVYEAAALAAEAVAEAYFPGASYSVRTRKARRGAIAMLRFEEPQWDPRLGNEKKAPDPPDMNGPLGKPWGVGVTVVYERKGEPEQYLALGVTGGSDSWGRDVGEAWETIIHVSDQEIDNVAGFDTYAYPRVERLG